MQGTEHWTRKQDVKLFLWRKPPTAAARPAGTILFVHGSSMASQPAREVGPGSTRHRRHHQLDWHRG